MQGRGCNETARRRCKRRRVSQNHELILRGARGYSGKWALRLSHLAGCSLINMLLWWRGTAKLSQRRKPNIGRPDMTRQFHIHTYQLFHWMPFAAACRAARLGRIWDFERGGVSGSLKKCDLIIGRSLFVVIRRSASNTQLHFGHYTVCWKRVLLESLDYLKMGLARLLSFCRDLARSRCLF